MFRQLSNAQLGYVSAGALILVQCFIAISFKASQTAGNKYTFSQASSLALTEIIKFLLSAVLFSQGASSAEILEAKSEDEQEMLWGGEDLGQTPSYPRLPEGRVQRLYVRWKNELSREAVLGFGALAVLYATNNHAAFFVYRLADPGTIQLVKVRDPSPLFFQGFLPTLRFPYFQGEFNNYISHDHAPVLITFHQGAAMACIIDPGSFRST